MVGNWQSRGDELPRLKRYVTELTRIFRRAATKDEAHHQSRGVLGDMSTDGGFITAVLQKHLAAAEVLNTKNYPVLGFEVELNPYYSLAVNCWIPLPGRKTDITTKAIHHHGKMLLTTVTIFGPGYEHWLFTKPIEVDPARELYAMEVTERRLHCLHDLAGVDAYVPHVPLYPPSLTITLTLWSGKYPTSWKDRLKRIPIVKRNEVALKRLAVRAGLARQLDLNIVEYFDFYPVDDGFKGMRERVEFTRGPNEDHLHSLFDVLQQTGNDALGTLVERHVHSGRVLLANREVIERLLRDLRSGRPIEGRLSECHLGVAHAMFTKQDIERAVTAARVRRPSETRTRADSSERPSDG